MKTSKLQALLLSLFLLLTLFGCASTGSGGAAANAESAEEAAPAVDRNEVGENGLLTPAALLARFIDATGGEEAWRSHTSSTYKGKFGISAMGMEGDMVVYAAAPNKVSIRIEMAGMGSMNQGYNGEAGWSENPMTGSALLEGDQLDQMVEQANFYGPLVYDEIYPSQETVELSEFNGESAYKLRLLNAAGKETLQYFSEESGLLIGTQGMQSSDMGEAEVIAVIGDYKDFDGLKLPSKTTAEVMGMEITQTIDEVTWDEVPENAFEPPPSIKALME